CRLRDIVCHRDAHAAQELYALGDLVDELVLLVVVLVEQEMQLIKSRAGDLPMMFLVQISKGDRVGQELVEVVNALFARLFRQRDRHPHEMHKRLNLVSLLMSQRRGSFQNGFGFESGFSHLRASSTASKTLWSPLRRVFATTRFRTALFRRIRIRLINHVARYGRRTAAWLGAPRGACGWPVQ